MFGPLSTNIRLWLYCNYFCSSFFLHQVDHVISRTSILKINNWRVSRHCAAMYNNFDCLPSVAQANDVVSLTWPLEGRQWLDYMIRHGCVKHDTSVSIAYWQNFALWFSCASLVMMNLRHKVLVLCLYHVCVCPANSIAPSSSLSRCTFLVRSVLKSFSLIMPPCTTY